MNASREAFDLFHPACRANFKRALPSRWRSGYWWRLVVSDTLNRVCSRNPAPTQEKGNG